MRDAVGFRGSRGGIGRLLESGDPQAVGQSALQLGQYPVLDVRESRSVGFADRLRRFGRDFQRVDRRTVAPEPEIQVRTCRQPGRAYVADELPLPYARSLGDPFRISFQVQVA